MRAIVMLELIIDGGTARCPGSCGIDSRSLWLLLVRPNRTVDDRPECRSSTQQPLVIDPPLRGGDWLSANGPSNTRCTDRALLVVNGNSHIAQRLAIDWLKIGQADGWPATIVCSTRTGSATARTCWPSPMAPSSQPKTASPKNVPLTDVRAVPMTIDTLGGNLAVVAIGKDATSFMHLVPKSLRVSVGAKVRRGQVLGLLGNSGNSDASHLHFHVTDGPSPLGSEGVPYVFRSMQHRGSTPRSTNSWRMRPGYHKAERWYARARSRSRTRMVVRFP